MDGGSGLVWGAVEAVVDEYIACGRGRRRDPVGRERLHGGAVEICGDAVLSIDEVPLTEADKERLRRSGAAPAPAPAPAEPPAEPPVTP